MPPAPLAWHVEVRCTNSYAPAAGSLTPDGACTLVHDAEPQPVPPWLTFATTTERGIA